MDVAESRQRHRALVETVSQGRAGLGSSTTPHYDKAERKDRRALLQEQVRAAVEEEQGSTMVGMWQQGAWTQWEQAVERKVTWTELLKAEPQHLKFLIQAIYDILPSPSNLFLLGEGEVSQAKRGTLEHILSCCPRGLSEGHYR